MIRCHKLKTWPSGFELVRDGTKRHEIRVNDRDFSAGDTLVLEEWDPSPDPCIPSKARGYTDRKFLGVITNVSVGGTWGLPSNMVVMSFRPLYASRDEIRSRMATVLAEYAYPATSAPSLLDALMELVPK